MKNPAQQLSKVGEVAKGIVMFLTSITGSDHAEINTVNDKDIEKGLKDIINEQDLVRIKKLESIYENKNEKIKDYVQRIKEDSKENKSPKIKRASVNEIISEVAVLGDK